MIVSGVAPFRMTPFQAYIEAVIRSRGSAGATGSLIRQNVRDHFPQRSVSSVGPELNKMKKSGMLWTRWNLWFTADTPLPEWAKDAC